MADQGVILKFDRVRKSQPWGSDKFRLNWRGYLLTGTLGKSSRPSKLQLFIYKMEINDLPLRAVNIKCKNK